jgi:hypothetical protein
LVVRGSPQSRVFELDDNSRLVTDPDMLSSTAAEEATPAVLERGRIAEPQVSSAAVQVCATAPNAAPLDGFD